MVQISYNDNKCTINKPALLSQLTSYVQTYFNLQNKEFVLNNLNGHFISAENYDAIPENSVIIVVLPGSKTHVQVDFLEECPPHKSMAKDMGNLNYTLVPALCEPIDNSLQSTIPFCSRNIGILVNREQGDFKIHDNGLGMTHEEIKSWATLGSGSHMKQIENSNSELRHKSLVARWENRIYSGNAAHISLSYYTTSKLSRYGVGVKYSAAKLGECFEAISLSQKSAYVNMAAWDTESKEWKIRFSSRTATEEEEKLQHFTKVNISRGKAVQHESHQGLFPLQLDEASFDEMLAKNLAQIYYYYIHGTQKLQKVIQTLSPAQTARENLRASVEGIPRALPDFALSPVSFLVNGKQLSDVPCAEDRYLQSAKSCFPVRFDLRAIHKDKTTTETAIQGCIFYYPIENGKETLPSTDAAVDDPTIVETQVPGVEYFWVGRLMPKSKPEMLPFMLPPKLRAETAGDKAKRARKTKSDTESEVPQRCFYRVRGMLFFDREFDVTQNKTEFVPSNPFFTQFLQMCADTTLCDKYQRWLEKCHRFDHEAIFTGDYQYVDREKRTYYNQLVLLGTEIKAGDYVEFEDSNGKKAIGEIVKFFHDGYPHETTNGSCIVNVWTHKFVREETRSLSQSISAIPKEKFEEHVDQYRKKIPTILDVPSLPLEVVAGTSITKFSVGLKSSRNTLITDFADSGNLRLVVEILHQQTKVSHKITTALRNSSFLFQTIGFEEDGTFASGGDYVLQFTSDPIEGKSLTAGPIELKVVPDRPHHLGVLAGGSALVGSPAEYKLACYDKFENGIPFDAKEVKSSKFVNVTCKVLHGEKLVAFPLKTYSWETFENEKGCLFVRVEQEKPTIGIFKLFFTAKSVKCQAPLEVSAGPPSKLVLSQFPREKKFTNMQPFPKIVVSLRDNYNNVATVGSRGPYKLEVTGTCISRAEFPLTIAGEFEIDRLMVQSMFIKPSKNSPGRQTGNLDEEWVGTDIKSPKEALDNETDFAAISLKGKIFYIGDVVQVGSTSATRYWVAKIERMYEDYRGKRIVGRFFEKPEEIGLEAIPHQLYLGDKMGDNAVDMRFEHCYVVSGAVYDEVIATVPDSMRSKIYWCSHTYDSKTQKVEPTNKFDRPQDTLWFWLIDAGGNKLLHTQKSISIIPDYTPKFLRILPPEAPNPQMTVNEKSLNTNPRSELEISLSLHKSEKITISGIRLEIVNESLIACKGVEGTISPIEGWTEENITVNSPQITLPDLEAVMSQQSASFYIEFITNGKLMFSNTVKLNVKSGLPSQIKLTPKTTVLRCNEPMPKLDVKITDQFGTLCSMNEHPMLTVLVKHIEGGSALVPQLNEDWQFEHANFQKPNLSHFSLADLVMHGLSGFYKLIIVEEPEDGQDLGRSLLEGAIDIELRAGTPKAIHVKPEVLEVNNGEVLQDVMVVLHDECTPAHVVSDLQRANLVIAGESSNFHFDAISVDMVDGAFNIPHKRITQGAGTYRLMFTVTWKEKKASKTLTKEVTLKVNPGTQPNRFNLMEPLASFPWKFTAGDKLPDMKLALIAENSEIIKLETGDEDVSLVLTNPANTEISYAITIDDSGLITFHGADYPKLSKAGVYRITVSYKRGFPFSKNFTVDAGMPSKMKPQQNTTVLHNVTLSGTLSSALTLILLDDEENLVTPQTPFSVSLSVSPFDDAVEQVPALTCHNTYEWREDKLTFTSITVEGNSNVPSGEYMLVFTPSLPDIPPLQLSFLYSDGAEIRELHEQLTQAKTRCLELQATLFSLEERLKEAKSQEQEKRTKLNTIQASILRFRSILPSPDVITQIEAEKKAAERMPEQNSTILHQAMRQTITQLKGGTLGVSFLGIAADLAFCPNQALIDMFGEHLGSKMCTVVAKDYKEQDAIKNALSQHRLPGVPIINMELLRKKSPPKILPNGQLDLGPVNSRGFMGYAVNALDIPPEQSEMRAYLWYHMFGKAMIFDNIHNARQYLQLSYSQSGHSPTLFAFETRERVGGDGFEMAGMNARTPSACFGITPLRGRPAIQRFEQVQQQMNSCQRFNEQAVALDEELRNTDLQMSQLQSELNALYDEFHEKKKQRDILQRKIDTDAAHPESGLEKRRRK